MKAPIRSALVEMLDELEASRLEVVLVPQRTFTNVGGMVRVAVSKNCDWYRALCAANGSSRVRRNTAHDTLIKRQQTLLTLRRLIAGETVSGLYASRLTKIAERRATRGTRSAMLTFSRRPAPPAFVAPEPAPADEIPW